jgi:hypothetical protein
MKLTCYTFLLIVIFTATTVFSQDSVIVSASEKYEAPSLLNVILIGRNYRQIWATPVKMKLFDITKEKGGLKATELGGGFQTKSLRLKDKNGIEWVLRTVDKDVEKAMPVWLRKTFAQDLVQDMISAGHPYAPLTVAHIAKALNIAAPDPQLVFVPDDPAFKEYQEVFANKICMIEKSNPTIDDSDSKSTDGMYEKLRESSENFVDDTTLLKARLLDMLIADWDRHADQWKWGVRSYQGRNMYYPIPRDRDQAFFLSTGLLVKVVRLFTLKHFVGFTDHNKKLIRLNGKSYEFDKKLLNKLDEEDWKRIISSFQRTVNDQLLIAAINKMPPEVVEKNGDVILDKLKKRRDGLMEYGMKYYAFINKEVEVDATEEADVARVTAEGKNVVLTLQNSKSGKSYYTRNFDPAETKKITLRLFDGADQFIVDKNVSSPIRFALDAGKGSDRFFMNGKLKLEADKETEKKIAGQPLADKTPG